MILGRARARARRVFKMHEILCYIIRDTGLVGLRCPKVQGSFASLLGRPGPRLGLGFHCLSTLLRPRGSRHTSKILQPDHTGRRIYFMAKVETIEHHKPCLCSTRTHESTGCTYAHRTPPPPRGAFAHSSAAGSSSGASSKFFSASARKSAFSSPRGMSTCSDKSSGSDSIVGGACGRNGAPSASCP